MSEKEPRLGFKTVAKQGWIQPNRATFVGVFDEIQADVYAAYAVSRLFTTYSGPLMRVVRSADSAVLDVGFNRNGVLDTRAIENFVGAGDGSVSIWYDQTGGGRHALQTTDARRPKIAVAGVVVRSPNGRPTIAHATQYYTVPGAAGFSASADNLTVAAVGNITTIAASAALVTTQRLAVAGWYRTGLLYTPTPSTIRHASSATDVDNPPFAQIVYTTGAWGRFIGRSRFIDAATDVAVNGVTVSAVSGVSGSTPVGNNDTVIGASPNGGAALSGHLSAIVLSRAALSISDLDNRLGLINAY